LKAKGTTGAVMMSGNPYDDYTDFDEFGGQK
jgi:hypothetical protein